MPRLLLLIAILFSGKLSFAQTLEGEWKGQYEIFQTQTNPLPVFAHKAYNLSLWFHENPDKTYTVYSYANSAGSDSLLICKLLPQFKADSLLLIEEEITSPPGMNLVCPKKMFLRFNKKNKFTELIGTWKTDTESCNSSGSLYFWKKRDK